MRKLVTVREIESVVPHPNADALDLAQVGGWQVVVKRGEFKAGDRAFYFEIDSLLPEGNPAWEFLMARSKREYNPGVFSHRLKTIKLRGEFSQGLLLPVEQVITHSPSIQQHIENIRDQVLSTDNRPMYNFDLIAEKVNETDWAEVLGVVKYEPPEFASNGPNRAGKPRGEYPFWIPKTDQERVENCYKEMTEFGILEWVVQEKLEGSSITIYSDNGILGITSRNIDLKIDDESMKTSNFVRTALAQNLNAITQIPGRWAIRGELIGPGIQGNIYRLEEHEIVVFDVWDGVEQCYMDFQTMTNFMSLLAGHGAKFRTVPVERFVTDGLPARDLIIAAADGKSAINQNTMREGVVWKARLPVKNRFNRLVLPSFKAISRAYLLKQGD